MNAVRPLETTSLSEIAGIAALTTEAFSGRDLGPIAERLARRIAASPGDAVALMDLAAIRLIQGDAQSADALQASALSRNRVYRLSPNGLRAAPLRLLVVKTRGDFMANTPVEFLLARAGVETTLVFVDESGRLPDALPPHDVAFVAIGESDRNKAMLEALNGALGSWPSQPLNHPARIARLSRDIVCAEMGGHPGIAMPGIARLPRSDVAQTALPNGCVAGFDYPVLLRPVGSHAGQGLEKIEDATGIAPYLAANEAASFYAMPFVDYRSVDGRFRKYRIVLVDGCPFPVHMAISDHWMVHYLNADMHLDAGKRSEEAQFMEDFANDFAIRHAAALAHLHGAVGLDYFGMDCAETADGRLLVFEVDSALIVHDMDPPDLYPYKSTHMRRIFAAFVGMLERRAA